MHIKKLGFKIGLFLLGIIFLTAIFSKLLAPYNPYSLDCGILVAPNLHNILGTDGLGHDVLSMIICGTRTSIVIGLSVSIISALLGITVGGLAGYIGGRFDRLVLEFINVFMMIPQFFLVLLVFSIIGSNIFNIITVLSFTSWTGVARLMRGQAIKLKEQDFVVVAKSLGKGKVQIFFEHIIPNGVRPIIPNMISNIATAIMTESSLAFLGVGDPNNVSWGQIINSGMKYFFSGWWISTFAGLAIVVTILTFVLIGESLYQLSFMNTKI